MLHEKPFQGVNGSGKHNNWSLASDTGINMLDPGVTPHENIQFLLVLACIMKAVDRHADLLRQSAAVPGNDYRLGAQEAPPAIISIFVGEQLEDVIDQLISTGSATHSKTGGTLKTGVTTLPDFDKDATDRNRTSPFAFTGNKFEFRMVGSSDSVSSANVVLNTIVAEAFKEAADELEKADDFDLAVHDMIKKLLADHRRIIFNGNGYSEAWVEEAERRGLPNLKCMVDAIPSLVTDKAFKLFGDFGVYTKEELVARAEIEYESYAKSVNIEAKAMINIAGKQLIPAVVRYTTVLAQSLSAVKAACPEADNSVQTELLIEVSDLLSDMKVARAKLEDLVEEYQHIDSMEKRAHFCYDEIIPAMQALRDPADQLEMIVDKEYWPIPSLAGRNDREDGNPHKVLRHVEGNAEQRHAQKVRHGARNPESDHRTVERPGAATHGEKQKHHHHPDGGNPLRNDRFEGGPGKARVHRDHARRFPRGAPELKEHERRLGGQEKEKDEHQTADAARNTRNPYILSILLLRE